MGFICDFAFFVSDLFAISRKVYEKKSVICPSYILSIWYFFTSIWRYSWMNKGEEGHDYNVGISVNSYANFAPLLRRDIYRYKINL